MQDTTQVGKSVWTNDERRVSPGYSPVVSQICAHIIDSVDILSEKPMIMGNLYFYR